MGGWGEKLYDNFTSFHEWGPYERRGAHRAVKSRVVAMHVFFICICIISRKTQFSGTSTFHVLSAFVGIPGKKHVCFSEITTKCLGVFGEHPRPIRTHI